MDPNTRALIMGAAGAGGAEKLYVEDVFSTWLYTGNGGVQTITNGIDLSGKGGMVWMKGRSGATNHRINDTSRGSGFPWPGLTTNSLSAATADADGVFTFDSTGFSVASGSAVNTSGSTYVSWTFREQAKFFDVVTYTGNGSTNRQIAHSLGSVPGCIIIKSTSHATNWAVYHRSTGNTQYLNLNTTDPAQANNDRWNNTTPTSTVFTVGDGSDVNTASRTYVAYLFAHDAGGFGDSGNDNVVSCGSFTTDGSGNATVNLGWEPQWVMMKSSSEIGAWLIADTMRGFALNNADDARLRANASNAEDLDSIGNPTAQGFSLNGRFAFDTHIYIAIRRGPMKTPTDATEVFGLASSNGGNSLVWDSGSSATVQRRSQYADLVIAGIRGGSAKNMEFADRLRGFQESSYISSQTATTPTLASSSTGAEAVSGNLVYRRNDISGFATAIWVTGTGANFTINYAFRRAPGFFDVVAYAGTGSARTVAHNLGVAPELMIIKSRSGGFGWAVYSSFLGPSSHVRLNLDLQALGTTMWNNTAPSPTVFSVLDASFTNASSYTYIAYLFASCPGVSKVGSYTGTGTTLQINCGFTAGARFVLIKRTDSTGDWYVWDTARGIVSGNDPYLLLNSTAAEVTNTDFIDPLNSGFEISSTAPAAVNANGGSFIYLAIA